MKTFSIIMVLLFASAGVFTVGCKQQTAVPEKQAASIKVHEAAPAAAPGQAPVNAAMKLPANHPPINAPAGAGNTATTGNQVSGLVEEAIPAGKYIYLRLKTGTGEEWAAVPMAPLNVGDKATVTNAALMREFKSKTLGRSFKKIWFGTLATAQAAPAAAPQAPPVESAKPDPALGAGSEATGVMKIADLIAQKAALDGKTVTVEGKVVKFNPAILGKNWLHIQDGSGSAADKNHDITVTTADTAAVGDQVKATGIVILDKDYGSGYKYSIMIEKASISR
jgi:hypothetical protein